jgi:aminomuconate-semialdehyde/2-hydroxymuconate-6-semialdehyde dehydrogenase
MSAAVAGTIKGIFGNQGEVCLAGSRLYVERSWFDEFIDRLAATAGRLRIGDPAQADTQVGPLVSAEHRERVESYLALARDEHAEVRLGGERPSDPDLNAGFYFKPTILTGLRDESRVMREEIFGPVLVASPFDTEEEAVARANDTDYGLAAMVWTANLTRAHRVAEAIRAGTVWVNCFFVRDLRAPFGGAKASGIGREGGYFSREFFTEPKTITMDLGGAD